MDNRAMKMAMARKAGRAMGASASPDMMGRAMVRPGMGAAPGMKKMAGGGSTGGSYRRAADGIASKGKTKGKMVKMAYGGKC